MVYLGTMMVPFQVVMIPQFILLKQFHLTNTHTGLILLQAFSPFGVFMLRQYYLNIPTELSEAARMAVKTEADYFTTTLSISPLKNADRLNEIGMRLGEEYGVPYLPSDFKKKNGYKRSIELSREYDLYRQDYCGCEFSMNQRRR